MSEQRATGGLRQQGNVAIPVVALLFGLLVGGLGGFGAAAKAVSSCELGASAQIARARELGDLQGDVLRLVLYARNTIEADFSAAPELSETRDRINRRLQSLRRETGGQGPSESFLAALSRLEGNWRGVDAGAASILEHADLILEHAELLAEFSSAPPFLQAQIDELLRTAGESGAPADQLYLIGRQMVLLERIRRGLESLRHGGPDAVSSADRLVRDSTIATLVFKGLVDGDQERGISALKVPVERRMATALAEEFGQIEAAVNAAISHAGVLLEVREQFAEIEMASEQLVADIRELALAP